MSIGMRQTNTTDNTNHMLGGAIKNKGFSDYQKVLTMLRLWDEVKGDIERS